MNTKALRIIGILIFLTASLLVSSRFSTAQGDSAWQSHTQAVSARQLDPVELSDVNITSVSTGSIHTCALTTAGGVKCWGNNGSGQLGDGTNTDRLTPVGVYGLDSGVAAVSAGGEHTCVLTTAGGVKCWGTKYANGYTVSIKIPLDVTGLSSGVKMVSAGLNHSCAVTTQGAVKCWGRNDTGQLGDGTTTNSLDPVGVVGLDSGVTAVSAGGFHSCALLDNGAVKCWGDNQYGQLGDGTTTDSLVPVNVINLNALVEKISTGFWHVCIVTQNGEAKCWGSNIYGQLGDGSVVNKPSPVDVEGLQSGVIDIKLGDLHTCALVGYHEVECWGDNWMGQLGDGTNLQRLTPRYVIGLKSGVTSIGAGGGHSCAVVDTGVKCWGSNMSGELGIDQLAKQLAPVSVVGLNAEALSIGGGYGFSCALTAEGGVKCWGSNQYGQLGDGTYTYGVTPADVVGLSSGVAAITFGDLHTCVRMTNGGVKCWGDNSSGQLGNGTYQTSPVPVDVSGLTSGVTFIEAGRNDSCAVTSSGGVKCWGNGSNIPANITGLTAGVKAVAAGERHRCALFTNGGVKCVGYNADGELGDGTTTYRSSPVDVIGLTSGVAAITSGSWRHTCALLTGGGVKCWGNNFYGELGDGTKTDRLSPVDVVGLTSDVSIISAGWMHTCALTSSGVAKCWGSNSRGRLGIGSENSSLVPTDVVNLSNGRFIAAGQWSHACAIVTDGSAKCWGDNTFGQLGDGTAGYSNTPVRVVGLGTVTYSVSGRVADPGGSPIQYVKVAADFTHFAITGADGTYTITGLTAGTYTLYASSHNSFTPLERSVTVPPDQTGQDFTLQPVDLSIEAVLPVQVIEGQKLVKGKSTAVKVVVKRTGSGAVFDVPVQINYQGAVISEFYVAEPGNMDNNFTLLKNNHDWPLNFASDEITKTIYFMGESLTPVSTTVDLSATVDAENYVVESVETNNSSLNQSYDVLTRNWPDGTNPDFKTLFFQTDWMNHDMATFVNYTDISSKFMQGIFPVSDSGFQAETLISYVGNTEALRVDDGLIYYWELNAFRLAVWRMMQLSRPEVDRFVAVVPPGWFFTYGGGILQNALGESSDTVPGLVVVEALKSYSLTRGAQVFVPHEIGHTFSFKHDNNFASKGFWPGQGIVVEISDTRPITCFMNGGYNPITPWETWIDRIHYEALLYPKTKLLIPIKTNSQDLNSGVIIASGMIDITGTVKLDDWFTLPDGNLTELSSGPYAFEYQDHAGNILAQQSFDISFATYSITTTYSTETPFGFVIPNVVGTEKIVLTKNSVPLAQKVITPNNPEVQISSPNGGERIQGQVEIHWSGSDLDGDSLRYAVFFSNDNGASWAPIQMDLVDDHFLWDTSKIAPGSSYIVKVIATDGFNTMQDVSDAAFSIARPIFLPLVRGR